MAEDRISSVVLVFSLKAKLQNKPTSAMDTRVGSLNSTWHFPTAQHLKGLSITKTSRMGEKPECWWKDTGTGPAREQGSSKSTAERLLMPETTSG